MIRRRTIFLILMIISLAAVPLSQIYLMQESQPATRIKINSINTKPLGKLGMIVIVDALNTTLLQTADTPNIDQLASEGLSFLNAKTVLPSATTAAHVALVTGAPPEINGVVNTVAYNATKYHELLPDESPDTAFVDYFDMLRVKTLPEIAKENGVKVGLIISKSKLEVMAGLSHAADKMILLPNDVIGPGDPHDASYPYANRLKCIEWITNATLKTIEEFYQYILSGESALLIVHYAEPDYIQGALGVLNPKTIQLVEYIDSQIGRIINELKSLNLWSRTFFVLTADHGFTPVDPNLNLLSNDYMHLSALHIEHIVRETAGLLVFIYLKNINLLQDAVNELKSYPWVRNLWTRYPVENASGTLSDVGLNNEFAGDIVLDINPPYYASKYYGVGAHGGTVTQKIPMIFAGGLLSKNNIAAPSIIDIAPTLAKLYGFNMPNATGKALDIVKPTADVSIKANPGIAYIGTTVNFYLNYTISTTLSGLHASLEIYDENYNKIFSRNESISSTSGSLSFTASIDKEGTYRVLGLIADNDGNILGGKAINILVVKKETVPYPVEKVAIALSITAIFTAILIVIPIKMRRKIE